MKMPWLSLLLFPTLTLAAAGSPDSSFYDSLADGGKAEVDLGQLAQEKASDPKVKEFAAMMVKDHSAANDELEALAKSKNISLSPVPGISSRTNKAELQALSGSSFDKAYLSKQVAAHKDTVALLQKEIAQGTDPDAKRLAQKVLPTVESHLRAVQKMAASLAGRSAQG